MRDERLDENIARLTPPYHFVPNPRYVEGWHFRNADNSGPNDGSVNAPQEERDFVFSPEVGRSIDRPETPEQLAQLQLAGQGRLMITSLRLGNLEPGKKAYIRRMTFSIRFSWPSSWTKRPSELHQPPNKGMKLTKRGQLRSFAAYPQCCTGLSGNDVTAGQQRSN